jgi:hypothetical protein
MQQQEGRQPDDVTKPADAAAANGLKPPEPSSPTSEASSNASELAELRAQLKAMQVKIDKISGEG